MTPTNGTVGDNRTFGKFSNCRVDILKSILMSDLVIPRRKHAIT